MDRFGVVIIREMPVTYAIKDNVIGKLYKNMKGEMEISTCKIMLEQNAWALNKLNKIEKIRKENNHERHIRTTN